MNINFLYDKVLEGDYYSKHWRDPKVFLLSDPSVVKTIEVNGITSTRLFNVKNGLGDYHFYKKYDEPIKPDL